MAWPSLVQLQNRLKMQLEGDDCYNPFAWIFKDICWNYLIHFPNRQYIWKFIGIGYYHCIRNPRLWSITTCKVTRFDKKVLVKVIKDGIPSSSRSPMGEVICAMYFAFDFNEHDTVLLASVENAFNLLNRVALLENSNMNVQVEVGFG